MKKVIFSLFLLLLGGAIGLTYYGMQKVVLEEYYSIREYKGYVIDDDRRLEIEFYSKIKSPSFLSTDTTVFFYELDSESFTLEDVNISVYQTGEYYLFRLNSNMPIISSSELNSTNSKLKIITGKYSISLDLGPVSFLKSDVYELLPISDLFGSYSYINGYLYLAGINITINDGLHYIESLRLGNYIFGNLAKTEFSVRYNNILDISIAKKYNPKEVKKDYILEVKNNTMFIPVGFENLILFRSGYVLVDVDGKTYYIDQFDYMSNSYDPIDYSDLLKRGEFNASGM